MASHVDAEYRALWANEERVDAWVLLSDAVGESSTRSATRRVYQSTRASGPAKSHTRR